MPRPKVQVCLSPLLFPEFDVTGKIVVVIDILRATSTICTALYHGVKEVIPVESLKEAQQYKGEQYILAAERGGAKVEGFNYGNSPFEYMAPEVKGKSLVLTTTNGTRAFRLSASADLVIAASFLNMSTVAARLKEEGKDVLCFCAGWRNHFSLEDTLFAGALGNSLRDTHDMDDDEAFSAQTLYNIAETNLEAAVKNSSHYKRLAKQGIEEDIIYCIQPDIVPVLPIYEKNRIISDT